MDPVSRRLAAAAMGLAFGLSRDEELEKTRLDLERARMEREDFRQGNGPYVDMQEETLNSNDISPRRYRNRLRTKRTWRRAMQQETKLREGFASNWWSAREAMCIDLRESARKRRRLHAIYRLFKRRGYSNDQIADHAYDRKGDIDVGLDDDVSDTSSS